MAALVAVLLLAPLGIPAGAEDAIDGSTVTQHTLQTFDGVTIAFTVFQPDNASVTETVPLILHSHGWGGTRASTVGGIVSDLLDAGYGVLSFDARGHGESTGQAQIHHKDAEILDIIKLLDWAHDNLDWVTKEGAPGDKDMVLGAVGGSYGGAYQLMTASYDDRLDALVPQMTWNDLRYSLAPGNVVKSAWVDALYGFGLQGVDMDPRIHEWFAYSLATNQLPEEALVHLGESSPLPGEIDAATLLFQGIPDLLFNMNEALRNFEGIAAHNDKVAFTSYNGGHVLPGVQPLGFVGPSRDNSPCGGYNEAAIAWFDHHLLGQLDVAVPTGLNFASDSAQCHTVGGLDDLVARTQSFDALPAPNTAGSILVPLDVGTGVVAGAPTFSATFVGATETIFSAGLVKVESDGTAHIVADQSTNLRITPELGALMTPVELELAGVVTELEEGDQLFLRIDGLNEWSFSASGRTPGGGAFTGITVGVPFVATD